MAQEAAEIDNASMAQVRTHWLAASRYTDSKPLEELIAAHRPFAVALFRGLIAATDMVFDREGALVNPRTELIKNLRASYVVSYAGQTVTVTSNDVLKSTAIVLDVVITGTANNASALSLLRDMLKVSGSLATVYSDFAQASTENVKELSLPIRQFSWLVASAAGIVPDMAAAFQTSAEHRSIIANVQGKYKSLIACAERRVALHDEHKATLAALEKQINDPAFSAACISMLELPDIRSVDSGALKTLEKVLQFALDATQTYESYEFACRRDKWVPQRNLFTFFREHTSSFRNQVEYNSEGMLRVKTVAVKVNDEAQEVPVFELLNEMRWLSTHIDAIKYPRYEAADYGLKLGDNYLRWQSAEIRTHGRCSVLHAKFLVAGKQYTGDFVLGQANMTYRNNLQFEALDSKGTEFKVTRSTRIFSENGASVRLAQLTGTVKEPEIRYDRGVLGLRLPISWATETKRAGDKKADANSVKVADAATKNGERRVMLMTTPCTEKPESFKSLLDFRNSTAAQDGYVYWAGFDQGERDQTIGIYRTAQYTRRDALDFFDVAENKEHVATYSFRMYQANKRRQTRPDQAEQPEASITAIESRIGLLRRLIAQMGRYARKDSYYQEGKEKLRDSWPQLASGARGLGSYDEAMAAAEAAFDSSCSPNYTDVAHDPNYVVNVLYRSVRVEFTAVKDERKTKYSSQHQNDYVWIRTVDRMCSLINAVSHFGSAPTPRGAERFDFAGRLHTYRDNLMKQYRKEIAAFLRDACVTHGARLLAVEELAPTSYISDDTDANRKRALFSPAELQTDIKLACDLHDIAVIAVDETLTSRVAPNGSLGWRGMAKDNKHGEGRDLDGLSISWKNLYYIDAGVVRKVDADANATANIVMRALTCGASKPKIRRKGLADKKKSLS